MRGIQGFIVGFSISLVSVSFAGQLYSEHPKIKNQPNLKQNIEINLFKEPNTILNTNINSSLAKVEKESLFVSNTTTVAENNINSENDDEILSINIENIIPIDFSTTSESTEDVQISQNETSQDIVASLPKNDSPQTESESPWIVAKGSNHAKNQNTIKEYAKTNNISIQGDDSTLFSDNEDVSYKVAERIKQSIIFPIPDEILNDRNLTPTFIKKDVRTSKKKSTETKKQEAKPQTSPKKQVKNNTKPQKDNSKDGILNNISSWFSSDKKDNNSTQTPKVTKAPSYSSTNKNTTPPQKASKTKNNGEDFISFYKTLQETTKEHEQDKAVPPELKLSFQPERAEISGQTLQWIKAFSQKAKTSNSNLQIILDSNTQVDLQRRRLSLLYTIFMNSGLDPNKIEVNLAKTSANHFIIRLIKF